MAEGALPMTSLTNPSAPPAHAESSARYDLPIACLDAPVRDNRRAVFVAPVQRPGSGTSTAVVQCPSCGGEITLALTSARAVRQRDGFAAVVQLLFCSAVLAAALWMISGSFPGLSTSGWIFVGLCVGIGAVGVVRAYAGGTAGPRKAAQIVRDASPTDDQPRRHAIEARA